MQESQGNNSETKLGGVSAWAVQIMQKETESSPVPVEPTDTDRSLHELTHVPFKPWCNYCVMSGSRANQHSHFSGPAGEAQREHPTIQCDFFSWSLEKSATLPMVDVGRGMWQLLLSSNAMHKQLVELWWISFRASGMEQWSWHLTMNLFWLQVPIFANQCEPRMSLWHISVQTGWCGDKARTSIAERFVQSVRGFRNFTLPHWRWTEGYNSGWSSSDSMGCNACSMAL